MIDVTLHVITSSWAELVIHSKTTHSFEPRAVWCLLSIYLLIKTCRKIHMNHINLYARLESATSFMLLNHTLWRIHLFWTHGHMWYTKYPSSGLSSNGTFVHMAKKKEHVCHIEYQCARSAQALNVCVVGGGRGRK